jgi:hypothetical protein
MARGGAGQRSAGPRRVLIRLERALIGTGMSFIAWAMARQLRRRLR